MRSRRALPAVVALGAALAFPAVAQEKLTVEKIVEPALADAFATPEYGFLDERSALLLDRTVPAERRNLEVLDLTTGARRPAFERDRSLEQLGRLLAPAAPPKALSWPDAIHAATRRALYDFGGDLYLLDLERGSFRRLTLTAMEERCPAFSPDGRLVSFVRGNDVWVLDVAAGRERPLTRDGSETVLNGTLSWVYWEEIFGRKDTAIWWSPDSSAVAFLQADESKVDVSVFPEFEPATPRVIRQRYPKAGGANPAVRLGIVDIDSGHLVWARLGQPGPEYVVRVDWLPGGRRLAVQTLDRSQHTLQMHFVERASGKSRPILTENSPTSVSIHDDLRFLDGGASFLWSSERDGRNRLYLYRADGSLVRKLFGGALTLRASTGVDWVKGGVVAVDERHGLVYFTAIDGAPVAPALYRVALAGGAPERVSQEPGTHRVGFAPGGGTFLDSIAGFGTPPRLELRQAGGALVAVVAQPGASVAAGYGLQTPEFLTIPADDGYPLPAQISKPRDFDPARRYPVIVNVYGGPGAPIVRNDWQRDILFQNLLLEAGYVVAAVDNRSASGLSKTLADTSYRRLMAAQEVPDLLAAVRWLTAQPWVDPGRIGVWGWSGGGTFTLQLMTHSTAFKAGIAVAAVTDFRYYDTRWTESVLGLPADNAEGYRAASPATFARHLSGRLLLVHGTYDDNVHPQNAWRFARELDDAGIPFDMMIYPLEKHGITGARRHLYRTMLEFWQRNL